MWINHVAIPTIYELDKGVQMPNFLAEPDNVDTRFPANFVLGSAEKAINRSFNLSFYPEK